MTQNKTVVNKKSVNSYINSIDNEQRQKDSKELLKIMTAVTKDKPVMWGPSIIGYGSYHYKYDSGREGDFLKVGFSARKQALTLYGLIYYDTIHENNKLLEKLGPHKIGKGCLYIKKLADVDLSVLKQMIKNSYNN